MMFARRIGIIAGIACFDGARPKGDDDGTR
jgi:hypothetical protein